jgi:hypothetical protein
VKTSAHVRVLSSVVERLVYTENVGGSKPSAPTSKNETKAISRLA